MYETILFPTDGSDTAADAADHAINLAKQHDASLHVLYVVDHQRVSQMAPKLGTDHIKEQLQSEGEKITNEVADAASSAGLDTTTSLREGAPGETITNYAEEVGADAVVMGTNGRTGMDRLLMGSIAERVIQSTELPVMTVKRAESS